MRSGSGALSTWGTNLMIRYFDLVSINTLLIASGAQASFVSYGDLYESLIDHIIIPSQRIDTVSYCKIQDDDVLNVSRHRPVICSLNVTQSNLIFDDTPSHIAWQKLDRSVLQLYESELNNLLLEQPFGLYDNVYSCIDSRYNAIVDCIKTVSDSTLPRTKFRSYLKPYWNSSLKDLHAAMRDKRRKWIAEGRPRGCMFSSFKKY